MKLLSPEEFELCFIYFLKLSNYIFDTLCLRQCTFTVQCQSHICGHFLKNKSSYQRNVLSTKHVSDQHIPQTIFI